MSLSLQSAIIAYHQEFEQAIIGAVETIENRVPTNDECKAFGAIAIFPDQSRAFTWKGVVVAQAIPFMEWVRNQQETPQ